LCSGARLLREHAPHGIAMHVQLLRISEERDRSFR